MELPSKCRIYKLFYIDGSKSDLAVECAVNSDLPNVRNIHFFLHSNLLLSKLNYSK